MWRTWRTAEDGGRRQQPLLVGEGEEAVAGAGDDLAGARLLDAPLAHEGVEDEPHGETRDEEQDGGVAAPGAEAEGGAGDPAGGVPVRARGGRGRGGVDEVGQDSRAPLAAPPFVGVGVGEDPPRPGGRVADGRTLPHGLRHAGDEESRSRVRPRGVPPGRFEGPDEGRVAGAEPLPKGPAVPGDLRDERGVRAPEQVQVQRPGRRSRHGPCPPPEDDIRAPRRT
jgi:hypothetical protein